MAPGDKLAVSIEDTGSTGIDEFEFDYEKIGDNPVSLAPATPIIRPISVPGGTDSQEFSHSEIATTQTVVRTSIRRTRPNQTTSLQVRATVSCSCIPADTPPPPQEVGKVIIKKETEKGGGLFAFTGDLNFEIDTENGPDSVTFANLAPGEFEITESPHPDFKLKELRCTEDKTKDTVVNLNARKAIIKLQANETVFCKFVNRKIRDKKKGSIAISKQVEGISDGNAEFNFHTYNLTPSSFSLKDGDPAQKFADLDLKKIYKISEQPKGGYTLTAITCAKCSGATCTPNLNKGEISVSFSEHPQQDPVVECKFVNFKETDDEGEDITKLYIHRRVDNLLSHGPDRARILRRLDEQPGESLKDGGSYEPLKLGGSVKDGNTDVEFSTSLSQIRAAAASAASKQIADAGLSFNETAGYAPYALSQRFDLWVEGQVSSYDDTTGGIDRHGNFGVVYVGMDYAVAPGVLIGGLVQFDRTRENVKDPDITGSVEGNGWMAGPYIGAKLRDDLFFDARAAWGTSSNDIDLTDAVAGHRTGSFDTDRWLATASLTGNHLYGNLRISPQVSVEYGNEVSDNYFMNNMQKVNSVDSTIGRLTFGPEFGYKYIEENGTTFEPHLSVKGIWTFEGDKLELSTGTVELDQLRASIEGGVIIRSVDGYAVRAAGSYDGIGDDDLDAWTAKLWLNVPLN